MYTASDDQCRKRLCGRMRTRDPRRNQAETMHGRSRLRGSRGQELNRSHRLPVRDIAGKVLHAVAVILVLASAAEADEKAGACDLVTRLCSTCHGARGVSISPMFPHLAGQPSQYLGAQLKAFRDRSRADSLAQAFMWGMASRLTDERIVEIAA